MKRIFLLLIILFISSCAPHNQDDPPLLPIDFSLSLSKSKLKINEQSKLTIKLENDKDGERANFTYKSSDENVLKPIDFKDNVITLSAVSIGTATITVTETNYQTEKSVNLEVNGINITLNKDFLNLTKNNTFQLETNVSDVTFESSDNNVATVTNTGLVTAINNGDATIKVSYNPMPTSFATCEVSVSEILPEKTIIKQSYKEYGKNQYWSNYASAPSIGEINLLIIPIWFTESTTYIAEKYKSSIREDIELAYLGSNEEIGYRSVKTYYEEESGKKLKVNGTVTDWYQPSQSATYYGGDDEFGTRTTALAKEVTLWAKNTVGLDLTEYDMDKDGYLDGVIMIYAYPDSALLEALGKVGMDNFWAYSQNDTSAIADVNNPSMGIYFWASYDFMYQLNGSRTKERTGIILGIGNVNGQVVDSSTFIHEMGHMFGIYDYYDYNYDDQHSPAGKYTMQDENYSTHDPFTYIALNWASPYIPIESCTITIGDFPLTHDIILLTPEWNQYDSAFDEYILLELYSLTGLNENYKNGGLRDINLPNKVGIRVWHVDARLLSNSASGYIESNVTSNVYAGNYVFKLCDNSNYRITKFSQQTGSFISEKLNMLQLISHTSARNYGVLPSESGIFTGDDLFYEGDSFSLDKYKQQFLDMADLNYYTDVDKDIRLNNGKKLNWSFTVKDITTDSNNHSTATIVLNKLA